MASTIDSREVQKFQHTKSEWWNPEGKFKTLHYINPIRLNYIKTNIKKFFVTKDPKKPLHNLKVLDVGCGGGLLSEPLCRMGGKVTGIDVSETNVRNAAEHALEAGLQINYKCTSIEQLAEEEANMFDVILCLEVVEHVQNLPLFIKSCSHLLKKGGVLFISTMNKTIKSYLLAIVGAEYILQWLPVGTHSWDKFVKPSELEKLLREHEVYLRDITGMRYSPLLSEKWQLCQNIDVNYFVCALKQPHLS
jgi:2-polyprenyl-6-hydroxyphenyl methylase/3-demethylubiquinone-9 3-methyltransferase